MKREYKDYIKDILEAMEKVKKFTKGLSKEEFQKDDKTTFAVIRALEVIGEAAKKIPANVRNKYKKYHGRKWPACATDSSMSILASTSMSYGRQLKKTSLL